MKFKSASELLLFRKRAYYRAFKATPEGQAVLADLAKFCRATETCFHADPRVHAVLEGRREVFLRIMKHLGMSSDELMREFGAVEWQKNEE